MCSLDKADYACSLLLIHHVDQRTSPGSHHVYTSIPNNYVYSFNAHIADVMWGQNLASSSCKVQNELRNHSGIYLLLALH